MVFKCNTVFLTWNINDLYLIFDYYINLIKDERVNRKD